MTKGGHTGEKHGQWNIHRAHEIRRYMIHNRRFSEMRYDLTVFIYSDFLKEKKQQTTSPFCNSPKYVSDLVVKLI